MGRRLLALTLCAAMLMGLTGCQSITNGTAKDSGRIKIGFAQAGHESDWRLANTGDYQAVFTEEAGYDLALVDCGGDYRSQIKAIGTFIQQNMDYIILSPVCQTGWTEILRQAKDDHIPVILVGAQTNCKESLFTAWVGHDAVMEGRMAGNWLEMQLQNQERLEEETNIVLLTGNEDSQASQNRREGFYSIVENHENWHVTEYNGGFTRSGGQEAMNSALASGEEFDIVVSENDAMSLGALAALEAKGIETGDGKDVEFISFEASRAGLEQVLEGTISVEVECNPYQASSVEAVIQRLERGEEVEQYTTVPDRLFTAVEAEAVMEARTY